MKIGLASYLAHLKCGIKWLLRCQLFKSLKWDLAFEVTVWFEGHLVSVVGGSIVYEEDHTRWEISLTAVISSKQQICWKLQRRIIFPKIKATHNPVKHFKFSRSRTTKPCCTRQPVLIWSLLFRNTEEIRPESIETLMNEPWKFGLYTWSRIL